MKGSQTVSFSLLLVTSLGVYSRRNNVTIPCGRCKCSMTDGVPLANCAGLNLTKIPPEVPNITQWLDLSNNSLNLSGSQFLRFSKLHMLNISGNRIKQICDDSFKGLDNLKILRLDANSLSYDNLSTTLAFKPLKKLHVLNISSNGNIQSEVDLDYPDQALKYLKHLEILLIDGLPYKSFGEGFKHLKRLTEIDLSTVCSIRSLANDTFIHVTNVKTLILRDCHISMIDPTSLEPLTELSVLDVSNNKLIGLTGLQRLSLGFRNAPLKSLYIDSIVLEYTVCVILKDEFIANLQNTNLTYFSANHNFIETFGDNALKYFPPTLKSVSLRENKFTFGPYLKFITSIEQLEEIDLSGRHRAHEFPQFKGYSITEMADMLYKNRGNGDCQIECQDMAIPPIPSTPHITKSGEVTIPVPPNLKRVTYSYSQLPYHIGKIKIDPNVLDYVDISSNIFSTWSGPVTGLEKLKILDLSNNLAKHISPTFFHTLPGLQILNVSDNFMGTALYNDTEGIVFRHQSRLHILNLRSNYVLYLHKKVFSGLHSLRELNLADNSIHPNLAIDIRHMKNLTRINCRNNQIRWVDREVTATLDQLVHDHSHDVYLDLSQNPIACTCYNLEFLYWMCHTDVHFGNLSEYYCLYSNGKNQSLQNVQAVYDDLNASCHNYFGLSLGVLAAFILILAVMLSAVGYRYRWKLTYWYYAARLRYSKLTEKVDETQFEFDVFVSFAEEDRDFIVTDLVEKLENEAEIRLNIHQRNFRPGRPIATNIVDAVKNSKRTLIILSPDFLESYWCIFELQMAQMESFNTGRDVLLIVMLKNIPNKDIPPEILYHIQSDSYLEYPLEGSKDIFWKTLIESLNK